MHFVIKRVKEGYILHGRTAFTTVVTLSRANKRLEGEATRQNDCAGYFSTFHEGDRRMIDQSHVYKF